MNSTKYPNIGVIVVVFHPEEELLRVKLQSIGGRFHIVVVDNTPNASISIAQENVDYIPLRENTGIANAQNVGIHRLEELGCSHIVFFDQDSEFSEAFVLNMVAEYERIEETHKNLFLLGPRVINKTNGEEYRSVVHREALADNSFVRKREIISSGSCVSMAKLREIGVMDARLFIDFVDFEYCWRANGNGCVCGITNNVSLAHKVGNRELHFPHGYHVIISAPFRYYYQYRNWLWLCRYNHVPRQWKIINGIKFFLRIFYFPLCVKGWCEIEKFMFKGIKDGIFKY